MGQFVHSTLKRCKFVDSHDKMKDKSDKSETATNTTRRYLRRLNLKRKREQFAPPAKYQSRRTTPSGGGASSNQEQDQEQEDGGEEGESKRPRKRVRYNTTNEKKQFVPPPISSVVPTAEATHSELPAPSPAPSVLSMSSLLRLFPLFDEWKSEYRRDEPCQPTEADVVLSPGSSAVSSHGSSSPSVDLLDQVVLTLASLSSPHPQRQPRQSRPSSPSSIFTASRPTDQKETRRKKAPPLIPDRTLRLEVNAAVRKQFLAKGDRTVGGADDDRLSMYRTWKEQPADKIDKIVKKLCKVKRHNSCVSCIMSWLIPCRNSTCQKTSLRNASSGDCGRPEQS